LAQREWAFGLLIAFSMGLIVFAPLQSGKVRLL
jgi:hypothetical protein